MYTYVTPDLGWGGRNRCILQSGSVASFPAQFFNSGFSIQPYFKIMWSEKRIGIQLCSLISTPPHRDTCTHACAHQHKPQTCTYTKDTKKQALWFSLWCLSTAVDCQCVALWVIALRGGKAGPAEGHWSIWGMSLKHVLRPGPFLSWGLPPCYAASVQSQKQWSM